MECYNEAIYSIGEGRYKITPNRNVHRLEVVQIVLSEKMLCDIKIETEDGTIVKGHKVVLASASPYFRAMFTFFNERNKDHVVIRELNSVALQILVDFIYTSEILVTEDNVQVLLHSATFLQISDVQDACCHFLKSQLHPTKCLGIWKLADLYNCMELLSSCESYIQQNFSKVIKNDEFLSLSAEQVVKFISSDELTVKSEEKVFECIIYWVNHNPDNRRDTLSQLMKYIRLPLMYAEYLQKKLEEEPLVKHDFECQHYINDALLYKRTFNIKPTNPNTLIGHTKPRRYTVPPKGILVVGGQLDSACGMEWYDFSTNVWESWPDIRIRNSSGLVVMENRWLSNICGQIDGFPDHTYKLDLFSSYWVIPSLHVPMICIDSGISMGVIDNRVYTVGRWIHNHHELQDFSYGFDCGKGDALNISVMHKHKITQPSAGVLNNLLYAVGGFDDKGYYLASVECYDPSTNGWTLVADMCISRAGPGVGALKGVLYAVGGDNIDGYLKSVETYNPSTGRWTLVSDMNIPRKHAGVVAYDGLLYVVGGTNDDSDLDSVEVYNPDTNTWSILTATMNVARSGAGVFLVPKPRF